MTTPRAHLIRLAECTSPEARALARQHRTVVLLPLGAIEQHGPHLPLLVDWLGAEELARRLAPHLARAGWRPILAPALPYGASPLAERWPGTVSLSEATLARVIVEIVGGLARHGWLPPRWVDFRAALARGARRFEQMDPGGRGYFGSPAAARAGTARRAMALRARLMAKAITEALGHAGR